MTRHTTILMAALLACACGARSKATGHTREVISSSGVVDLDQLTTAETLLLIDIVGAEASPCAGELSLLDSLEKPKPCEASVRALGFIYRRILEGYGREDVLDQYVARFKQAETVDIDISGSPDTGPAGARVTIVVFSDFGCPYCRKAAGMLADLKDAFPEDVRIVYLHLPLTDLHPDAMNAAVAAAAAHMQGQFWPMHDALYALEGDLDADSLEEAAEDAGLDMDRWHEDLESPDALDLVNRDVKQAQDLDLDATPTIFVDGMHYTEPLKYIDQVVEERLLATE